MRVYCTGRHSEPHNEQAVHGVFGLNGEVFECPLCKYDVRVDREFEAVIEAQATGHRPIELHHLAQLVTAARANA